MLKKLHVRRTKHPFWNKILNMCPYSAWIKFNVFTSLLVMDLLRGKFKLLPFSFKEFNLTLLLFYTSLNVYTVLIKTSQNHLLLIKLLIYLKCWILRKKTHLILEKISTNATLTGSYHKVKTPFRLSQILWKTIRKYVGVLRWLYVIHSNMIKTGVYYQSREVCKFNFRQSEADKKFDS